MTSLLQAKSGEPRRAEPQDPVVRGATITYNLIAVVVALWAGGVADSAAHIGFGLDSVIEVMSVLAVLRQGPGTA